MGGGQPIPTTRPLTFTPIEPNTIDDIVVAKGYKSDVLIRWGDPLTDRAPQFDFHRQTPEAQAEQFGTTCDFLALIPCREDEREAVLWANHEHINIRTMFPDLNAEAPTRKQVDTELAALGGSVVVIRRVGKNRYRYIRGHRLNRRITGETPILLTGPAAGSPLLQTFEDPTGTRVRGTLFNCAGGVTPWNTVLTCEENFNFGFANVDQVTDSRIHRLHARYGPFSLGQSVFGWERYHPRFDLGQEPHEPFRFGWVVEVDPLDPSSTPRKRTAMGRLKHEAATSRVAEDGRVAFYMGDDAPFEYIYKFVTNGRIQDKNPDILDDGVLYVARFDVDECGNGVGEWLPLVHGERGLTAKNGFASQADVLVNTRGAADVVGATRMDRPEDIETNPVTGVVYVALASNPLRGTPGLPGPDPANPRSRNVAGHVIELIEDDATSERFTWQIFLLCGDPNDLCTDFAGFPKNQVSPIAGPGNLTFDHAGNLWIATDGQPGVFGFHDAFHAVPVVGDDRGHTRMFASVPRGAEATGPVFSPDGRTLFGSVQFHIVLPPPEHPQPVSTWPDRTYPPRSSVVTFWKADDDPHVGY